MNNIVKSYKKEIGEIIRKERKAKGLSLDDLADKLSTTRQTVSKWEKGEEKPSPSLYDLLKMCELFNCDFGYLIGEYDCKTRTATDIQKETGLSEKAIENLCHLSPNERRLINDLLLSETDLSYLALAYVELKEHKKNETLIKNSKDLHPNLKNDLDYIRFTLSNRFALFAEKKFQPIERR